MNHHFVINVAVMVPLCLVWPSAIGAHSMMNRYGKQQLAQKQNRYGSPTWLNSVDRATGWASSYAGGGSMMRYYPMSMNRYQAKALGNRQLLSDDYYDTDIVNPHDPRSYDRLDYAVVRYPSYGVGGGTGYYSMADLYDGSSDDNDLLYDDMMFNDRDSVPTTMTASSSSYYPVMAEVTAADRRYTRPLTASPSNRYESTRSPTDKIHRFRKVFLSNLVSPSNAFKTPKERQLYDFWESLINGDLDSTQQTDNDDGRQQRGLQSSLESETSQLHQHLPSVFQKLLKQQKQKQKQEQKQQQQQQQQKYQQQQQYEQEQHQNQEHQQLGEERMPLQSLSSKLSASLSSLSSPLSSASSSSSSSSATAAAALSQSVPRSNLYKQWANGSPLIKRSSAGVDHVPTPPLITSLENDDVRQLKMLKSNAIPTTTSEATTMTTTMVSNISVAITTTTTPPSMADGGQREYVLPRPAGEKSGFESLLEVMAEGGLQGHFDKNAATAYSQLHQEAKVNKKRSFVSDESSLAAQLGALRKN